MPPLKTFLDEVTRIINSSEALVVGGAVRDRLLGRPVFDFDIVLPHNPKREAEEFSKKLKGKWFPLDEERGIFRVTFDDGRYIDLAQRQGSTQESDIDRRDFTINALAVPLKEWGKSTWKKRIIDRHNGLRDLRRKTLVSVSPHIFKDDPLRLLRAFRISTELNFSISAETKELIKKEKKRILKSAPERIRDEWMKMFLTPRSYQALLLMEKTGLLEILFPEAASLRATAPDYYGKGGVLKHTLDSVAQFEEILKDLKSWFPSSHKKIRGYLNNKIGGYPLLAHCKWALLLHDVGKPKTAKMIDNRLRFFEHEHVGADMVQKMPQRYRWSVDETQRYARLVKNHMRPGNLASQPTLTDKAIYRFFRDLGEDGVAMLLVSLADHLTYLTPAQRKKRSSDHEKTTIQMIKRYYHQRERVVPQKILNGYEVMKHLNLPSSPLIGTLLKNLEEAQSEGKIKDKTAALQFLKEKAKSLQIAPNAHQKN